MLENSKGLNLAHLEKDINRTTTKNQAQMRSKSRVKSHQLQAFSFWNVGGRINFHYILLFLHLRYTSIFK